MVLHNPNNWHWVNKDVSPWTKQWFQDNLSKLEARDGDVRVAISKVQSMDGDVDVSQRKGKVITIFDVKLVLEYTGKAPLSTYCVPWPLGSISQSSFFLSQAKLQELARSREPSPYPKSPTTPTLMTMWFVSAPARILSLFPHTVYKDPDSQLSPV